MKTLTPEQLQRYLDDALSDAETAEVEHALRSDSALQKQLRALMQQRDRGEHSIGAVWVRNRLSCPSREQLGSYLLGVLEDDHRAYIDFHLTTIGCAFCQANHADLQRLNQEPAPRSRERRRKYYESSVGVLRICGDKPPS